MADRRDGCTTHSRARSARTLRIAALVSFPIGLALLAAFGAVSDALFPTLCILPLFFSFCMSVWQLGMFKLSTKPTTRNGEYQILLGSDDEDDGSSRRRKVRQLRCCDFLIGLLTCLLECLEGSDRNFGFLDADMAFTFLDWRPGDTLCIMAV